MWGDLGGCGEAGESSERTAAREFAEESLGAVNLGTSRLSGHIVGSQLERELREGMFFLRLRIFYMDGTDPGTDQTEPATKAHPTHCRDFYLKEIPFDPSMSPRFDSLRETLLRVPEGIDRECLPPSIRAHPAIDSESCILSSRFLEKQHLRWFSLDHTMDIVTGNGCHLDVRVRRSFLPALRVAVAELLRFVPEE
jgi:hypothetical protein